MKHTKALTKLSKAFLVQVMFYDHLFSFFFFQEKTPQLGTEGKRRREWQRIRWLDSITDSTDMNLRKLREIVKDREAMSAVFHEVAKSGT